MRRSPSWYGTILPSWNKTGSSPVRRSRIHPQRISLTRPDSFDDEGSDKGVRQRAAVYLLKPV